MHAPALLRWAKWFLLFSIQNAICGCAQTANLFMLLFFVYDVAFLCLGVLGLWLLVVACADCRVRDFVVGLWLLLLHPCYGDTIEMMQMTESFF